MNPSSSTQTLISALRILAQDIKSEDGVANSAIAESADRMEMMLGLLNEAQPIVKIYSKSSYLNPFTPWQQDWLYKVKKCGVIPSTIGL